MDRDTTSRDAKSFAVGAYLHCHRHQQVKQAKDTPDAVLGVQLDMAFCPMADKIMLAKI